MNFEKAESSSFEYFHKFNSALFNTPQQGQISCSTNQRICLHFRLFHLFNFFNLKPKDYDVAH
jgi:hypothetical protein